MSIYTDNDYYYSCEDGENAFDDDDYQSDEEMYDAEELTPIGQQIEQDRVNAMVDGFDRYENGAFHQYLCCDAVGFDNVSLLQRKANSGLLAPPPLYDICKTTTGFIATCRSGDRIQLGADSANKSEAKESAATVFACAYGFEETPAVPEDHSVEKDLVWSAMCRVGKPMSAADLSTLVRLPAKVVKATLGRLSATGYARHVEEPSPGWVSAYSNAPVLDDNSCSVVYMDFEVEPSPPVAPEGFRYDDGNSRVLCAAADSEDSYSRMMSAADKGKFGFELQVSFRLSREEYEARAKIGATYTAVFKGRKLFELLVQVCDQAVKDAEARRLAVPATAPERDIVFPTTNFVGANADLFVGGVTFFPTQYEESGAPRARMFALVRGDVTSAYGPFEIPAAEMGEAKVFGFHPDVKAPPFPFSGVFTALPVSLSPGTITLLPMNSLVTGNSWHAAAYAIMRQPQGEAQCVVLTGSVSDSGKLAAGALALKTSAVSTCGWRTERYGRDVTALLGPGCPCPASNVDDLVYRLVNLEVKVEPVQNVVCDAVGGTRITTQHIIPGLPAPPRRVVRETVVTTPDQVLPVRRGRGRRSGSRPRVRIEELRPRQLVLSDTPRGAQGVVARVNRAKDMQTSGISDRAVGRTSAYEYTKTLVDPFGAASGCKIPDMTIYPSTTSKIESYWDLQSNERGEIVVMATAWHRSIVATSALSNRVEPYEWYNFSPGSEILDYKQADAFDENFAMARPVAAGARLTYVGTALEASGTIVGALSDPGQHLPMSFDDVTNLPEFREYSVAAESAGVELFHKPMTMHNLPYQMVKAYPAPYGLRSKEGGAAFPSTVDTNSFVHNRAVWLTDDTSGTTANIGVYDSPFMILAGKGFKPNSPFRLEVVVHFETTVRAGTFQVGRNVATPSVQSAPALVQATAVLAQMPSVRKPSDNFLGKLSNIIRGIGDVANAGFGVANNIKRGVRDILT